MTLTQFLKIDKLSDGRRAVIFVYLIFAGAIVGIAHGNGAMGGYSFRGV